MQIRSLQTFINQLEDEADRNVSTLNDFTQRHDALQVMHCALQTC